MKWTIEGNLPSFDERDGLDIEDSGCAVIGELSDDNADNGMFIRIQSWNDQSIGYPYPTEELIANHPEIAMFAGKRIRVTVEVIE